MNEKRRQAIKERVRTQLLRAAEASAKDHELCAEGYLIDAAIIIGQLSLESPSMRDAFLAELAADESVMVREQTERLREKFSGAMRFDAAGD